MSCSPVLTDHCSSLMTKASIVRCKNNPGSWRINGVSQDITTYEDNNNALDFYDAVKFQYDPQRRNIWFFCRLWYFLPLVESLCSCLVADVWLLMGPAGSTRYLLMQLVLVLWYDNQIIALPPSLVFMSPLLSYCSGLSQSQRSTENLQNKVSVNWLT